MNNYQQALAQSRQYGTNATSAQTNLSTEDNALSQVQTQLQALRTLALEANSGTLTNSNRSAIATQAVRRWVIKRGQLLAETIQTRRTYFQCQ